MNTVTGRNAIYRATRDDEAYPGESLLGFVTRRLNDTVIRSHTSIMRVLGAEIMFSSLPVLSEDNHVERLATLLDCSEADIRCRLYPVAHTPEGHVTLEFFGVRVAKHYRESEVRRVSPRALCSGRYHRAIWELRPLSFDPGTRELLLDHCPVCRKPLGWKKVHGPHNCEKCLDERGFPKVDLRDFPQRVIEVDDEEALSFVTGLVAPDGNGRARARRMLPAMWSEFSIAELFEAVMAMATGLCRAPSSKGKHSARGRSLADFSQLQPEFLALAGRAIIGGEGGFAALASRYRADAHERAFHYGKCKELGVLSFLPRDNNLSPGIRRRFWTLIDGDMRKNGSFGLVHNDNIKGRDFLPIYRLVRLLGVRMPLLAQLARSGLVRTITAKGTARHSKIQMSVTDVAALVDQLKNATSVAGAANLLGLPRTVLSNLADRRLLSPLDGPVLQLLPGNAGYSTQSVQVLRGKIWDKARRKGARKTISIPAAARLLGAGEAPWGAIISAIVSGDVEVFIGKDKRGTIRQTLVVEDQTAFVIGVRKHLSSEQGVPLPVWISAPTAAELLQVNEAFFYRLLSKRPDILRPSRSHQSWRYSREDVKAVANAVIFAPEVSRRVNEPVKQIRSLLQELGLEPSIALQKNRDFGWQRGPVETIILAVQQRKREAVADLPSNSTDGRVELIRMVARGSSISAAARKLGINYSKAHHWVVKWRKSGRATPDESLDDQADFVRDLVRRQPTASIEDIAAALAKRGHDRRPNTIRRFLSRNKISLKDPRSKTRPHEKFIQDFVSDRPEVTLTVIQEALSARNLETGKATIWRTLKRLGIVLKRKGRIPKLAAHKKYLRSLVSREPNITGPKIQRELLKRGVKVAVSTINVSLERYRIKRAIVGEGVIQVQ